MAAIGARRGVRRVLCELALGALLAAGGPSLPAFAADATICRYVSQLPDDCGGATQRRYDNLRGARFEEIDLFARDIFKKALYESRYNTTGLNAGEDSADSAPPSLVQALNAKAIAKQYQALFVLLSPPRHWTIDWLSDRVGGVRNFDGLEAAWMGNGPAPKGIDSKKPPPSAYRYMSVPRTSIEGFKKGSTVYLLDDPKDRTWVMRSYTDRYMNDLSLDNLATLGERIALPQGWKFRTAVLKRELVLEPKSGSAGVIEDDKGNIYDLTGPGQSNFKP